VGSFFYLLKELMLASVYLPVEGVDDGEWICTCLEDLMARSGSVPVEGVDGEEWICTC
jgi:hypothetical protein